MMTTGIRRLATNRTTASPKRGDRSLSEESDLLSNPTSGAVLECVA